MNTEELANRLVEAYSSSHYTNILLTDLFKEKLKDGKLHLDGINFLAIQFILETECGKINFSNVDFSNCIFSNCDFSHIEFYHCSFTHSQFAENNTLIDVHVPLTEGLNGTEEPMPEVTDWRPGLRFPSRKKKLEQRLWSQYPEFYFNYSYQFALKNIQSSLISSNPKTGDETPFLNFDYDSEQMLGWKLHFAVNPEHLNLAFSLIAPIISRYCQHFKIIIKDLFEQDKLLKILETTENEDFPCYSILTKCVIESREQLLEIISQYIAANRRIYQSAQMTIYLEGSETIISADHLEKMLKEIDALLLHQDIKPTILPLSDATTISPYFSLRNDKMITKKMHGFNETKSEYIAARLTGTNFNPNNLTNPYQHLLRNPTHGFNLVKHFESLPKAKLTSELYRNLLICMHAYLNEYTLLHSGDREKQKQIIKKLSFCTSIDSFPKKLIKEEYRKDKEVLKGIMTAGQFFSIDFSDLLASVQTSNVDIKEYMMAEAKDAFSFSDSLNVEFQNLQRTYEAQLVEICKQEEHSFVQPVKLCIPEHLFYANDPKIVLDEKNYPQKNRSSI